MKNAIKQPQKKQNSDLANPKLRFRKMLFPSNNLNKKWQRQNRIWKVFVLTYFIALILSSDHITAGYFLKHRLGVTNLSNVVYRIAIIDSAFDISKMNRKNIVAAYNVTDKSTIITKIPMFDYSGNIKINNHGTEIANLFIGQHGLLPNTQIIPIQVHSAQDLPYALEHALKNGAQAISISLAFAPNYQPLQYTARNALLNAAKYVPILIAAGNDGQALEATAYGRSMLALAKASDVDNTDGRIFLVAATKFSLLAFNNIGHEKLSDFSNYSRSKYVIHAPGESIKLGNLAQQIVSINSLNGTSIATPLALIRAIYSIKDWQTLMQALGK